MNATRPRLCALLGLSLALLLSGCDRIRDFLEREDNPLAFTQSQEADAIPLREGDTVRTLEGNTHGAQEADSFGPGCYGFIDEAPSARFELTEVLRFRLQARSAVDTTLIVTGPEGPHCDDDTEGLNPALNRTWQPGTYEVHVGSYRQQQTPFDYTLTFGPRESLEQEQEDEEAPTPQVTEGGTIDAPTPANEVTPERIRRRNPNILLTGDAPAEIDAGTQSELENTASFETGGGGERAAIDLGLSPECVGYYNPERATVRLERNVDEPLRITSRSEEDSTLVVRTPGGDILCSDDADGFDPVIEIEANGAHGEYLIWVGSYHRGELPTVVVLQRNLW